MTNPPEDLEHVSRYDLQFYAKDDGVLGGLKPSFRPSFKILSFPEPFEFLSLSPALSTTFMLSFGLLRSNNMSYLYRLLPPK